MALKANLKEGIVSLYASKQRSLLALIGIVIGIGSVIAMVSVGVIAKRQALQQFKELGTEFLSIRAQGSGSDPRLRIRLADAVELPEELPSLAATAPWSQSHGTVVYGGKKVADAPILGVTDTFAALHKLQLEGEGRGISDLDFRRNYCVIGAAVASALRREGETQPVGKPIRLGERLCTIVGVLRSASAGGMQSFDPNGSVLVPFSTFQRMFPGRGVRQVDARMTPEAHHLTTAEEVRTYFRRKAPEMRIRVNSAQKVIEQMQRQMQTFALLLAAIGSISLVVGGIGVMNVMLVSVTERRKEIGIRRALGARRSDIRNQFLIEAVILSLVGGVFGILLAVGSTWIFCSVTGWSFLIDPTAMALGFLVACCVGVFFGLQPAVQAARLDPIDALRTG